MKITIPELVKIIKSESTKFINDKRLSFGRICLARKLWCFSYAKSQKDAVTQYILNQKSSSKRSFREEYLDFLEKFDINYDRKIFV